MIKHLSALVFGTVMLVSGTLIASESGSPAQGKDLTTVRSHQRPQGAKLTSRQIEMIETFHHCSNSSLPTSGELRHLNAKPDKVLPRINASGSTLEGYIQPSSSLDIGGWYEIHTNGRKDLHWEFTDTDEWGSPISFPFKAAFSRDGKMYGFYCELLYSWALTGHGIFTTEGVIEELEVEEDVTTDLSKYVFSCGYDANEDKAYVYSLNADGSAYMFQSVNPDTWEFSPIKDNLEVEECCKALCWCEADGKLYGVTPEGYFVTVNPTTGEFTRKGGMETPIYDTTVCGMTWSPADRAFYMVSPAGWDTGAIYEISPETGNVEFLANIYNFGSCTIFMTQDKEFDPSAPGRPEIAEINFAGGSLSGTAEITVPALKFNGTPQTTECMLGMTVDGEPLATVTGKPGETISFPISVDHSGTHLFVFTISNEGIEGPSAAREIYVGYDIPTIPTDVVLEEGHISWQPVTTGVNGGYVDTEEVVYRVYLNDNLLTSNPICETELRFEMPDEAYTSYVASVEAINDGMISERGYSNSIKNGHAYTLPVQILPTEAQWQLLETRGQNWSYESYEQSVFCRPTYEPGDEWLILPAIKPDNINTMILVEADICAADLLQNGSSETIVLTGAASPNIEDMILLATRDDLKTDYNEFKTFQWYFSPITTDDLYLAFHITTLPSCSGVKFRNINISQTDIQGSAPGKACELRAMAAPKGELRMDVSFVMPTFAADGSALPESQLLNGTVNVDKKEASVSAFPGQEASVSLEATQGWNDVTVTISNSSAGIPIFTRTYVGMDVPQPIGEVRIEESKDNMSATLYWTISEVGINGGYVDPNTVDYYTCYYDDYSGWLIDEKIGNKGELKISVPADSELGFTEVALAVGNEMDMCPSVRIIRPTLGKPYNMPVLELFDSYNTLEPTYTSRPADDYYELWGYTEYLDGVLEAECNTGAMICKTWDDDELKARITLPKFSSANALNPYFELTVYCAPNAGTVKVLMRTDGVAMKEVASIHNTSSTDWEKVRLALPEEFRDRNWVEISLDGILGSASEVIAIDSYGMRNLENHDLVVADVTTSVPFTKVGESFTITAKVENAGLEPTSYDMVKASLTNNGNTVAEIVLNSSEDNDVILPGEVLIFTGEFTPNINAEGELDVRIDVSCNDDIADNNIAVCSIGVSKGNEVLITDLKADLEEGKVVLTWTNPTFEIGHESFENFMPFSYYDSLGDFKCYDADGHDLYYFAYYSFPYQSIPKAWQVISSDSMTEIINAAGFENRSFFANDGDRFLLAFQSVYNDADDWLISPEVIGGSEVSFYIRNLGDSPEYFMVMASSATDSPEDFTCVEDFSINYSNDWKNLTVTLPVDARYFALRYAYGSNYVLLDDITFTPAHADKLVGVDVYRNNELLTANVPSSGRFIDENPLTQEVSIYTIIPVTETNGELIRGQRSNEAYLGLSSISNVEKNIVIAVKDGSIEINGLSGEQLRIYSVDGLCIVDRKIESDHCYISLDAGVYTVVVKDIAKKIIIR